MQTCQTKFPVVIVGFDGQIQVSGEFSTVVTVDMGSRVLLGKRVFGPLRLPDVKPPCSNSAPIIVGAFFFVTIV